MERDGCWREALAAAERMTITVGDDGNAKGILGLIWRPTKPKLERDFPAFLDSLAKSSGCNRINFLCD